MQVQRNAVIASVVGSYVEWYDFYLYGAASALVFNKLFFPQFTSAIGTILSLLTFSSGFLARPLGAYVCGYLGDRIGRKKLLMATMVAMGLATFMMGLVPTYSAIGVWGAVILVVLRLVQGFASGGEWSGALVMVAESVPEEKRGIFGGLLSSTTQAGFVSGAAIFSFLNWQLSEADFFNWGWRIPFLLSILTVGVGIYVRIRVPETEAFQLVKDSETVSENPVKEVLAKPRNAIAVMAIRLSENTWYYSISIFSITYGLSVGAERSVMLNAVTIGSGCGVLAGLVGGWLADRFGSRAVLSFGQSFQLLWIVPYYLLFNTGSAVAITIATVVAIVMLVATIDSPQAKFVPPLFPARLRYSGVAAGRETVALIGGLTPAIATALVAYSGNPWWFVTFLAVCSALGLGGIWLAKPIVDKSGRPLTA